MSPAAWQAMLDAENPYGFDYDGDGFFCSSCGHWSADDHCDDCQGHDELEACAATPEAEEAAGEPR